MGGNNGSTMYFDYYKMDPQFASTPVKNRSVVPFFFIIAGIGILLQGIVIVLLVARSPYSNNQTPGSSSQVVPATTEPTANIPEPTQNKEVISTGFIDAAPYDYANIYVLPDTGSDAVARVYTGDKVDIYAIEGSWYYVKFGSVEGCLEAVYMTFSEPVKETAAPATEAATPAPTAPTTAATLPKPSISASIDVDTSGSGDGGTFYLNVSGTYAYYVYEATEYLYDGSESEYLGSFTSSESRVRLTAGSIIKYVTAKVTPYHADGTAGDTVTCRGDLVYPDTPSGEAVTPCQYYGQINTHGGVVAGFTTSYVVNNGASGHVRDSLGNTWHVTAVNYCYSHGVSWYELYDSDDGDYYGWVDANYIDFY